MSPEPARSRPLTFRRRHRLSHAREFQRAFRQGRRWSAGPLTLFLLPNGLPHPRLGLSIGRRVGGAVARNRLKRLLREAFRTAQHDLPAAPEGSFDLVLTARAHEPLTLEEYRDLVCAMARRAADAGGGTRP